MPTEDDEDGVHVCGQCISESYLSSLINREGESGSCSYCNSERAVIAISELATLVGRGFDDHFYVTSTEPDALQSMMLLDRESDYNWDRDGELAVWAILNAINSTEDISEDIREHLAEERSDWDRAEVGDEQEFCSESHYAESGINTEEMEHRWRQFEHTLKFCARHFSPAVETTLQQFFNGIETMTTDDGRPIILEVSAGHEKATVYRARAFTEDSSALTDALAYPWRDLAGPPPRYARAGRMNARGVSIFYGAYDESTAIAEIRPPVGCRVVVGKFEIIRPLRLLDLTALDGASIELESIFKPGSRSKMERSLFLRTLSTRLSRPVMPHEEDINYLPTQVIAEYLANKLNLDGIIYPSVQGADSSSNVALFHRSSRVDQPQFPPGSQITASEGYGTEDGYEQEYHVRVEIAQEAPIPTLPGDWEIHECDLGGYHSPHCSELTPSLRIDLAEVKVHHITAAQFSRDDFSVTRTTEALATQITTATDEPW